VLCVRNSVVDSSLKSIMRRASSILDLSSFFSHKPLYTRIVVQHKTKHTCISEVRAFERVKSKIKHTRGIIINHNLPFKMK